MNYFGHHFASNSDIKEIVARAENRQKPDNIQEIYDFGSNFHAGIVEPHKCAWADMSEEDADLVRAMSKTFWKDKVCRDIAMTSDFRREHEFYRINRFGLEGARCKADGETKKLQLCLELKGLSLSSEKQFKEAILFHDYDQATAWYLPTMTSHTFYRRQLIVGISKIDPGLLFKMLIDRDHPYYKSGTEKVKKGVMIWKSMGYN